MKRRHHSAIACSQGAEAQSGSHYSRIGHLKARGVDSRNAMLYVMGSPLGYADCHAIRLLLYGGLNPPEPLASIKYSDANLRDYSPQLRAALSENLECAWNGETHSGRKPERRNLEVV